MTPLLPYFLAYLCGILAALPAADRFFLPHALPLCVLALAGFLLYRSRTKAWGKILVFICLVPAGFYAPVWTEPPRPANHILNHLDETQRFDVEADLTEIPATTAERTRFFVALKKLKQDQGWIPVSGRAQVTLYSDDPRRLSFEAGDTLRFHHLRLKRPRNFKNPGRFDYERHMQAKGIDVTGNLSKIEAVQKIGTFPLPFTDAVRIRIRQAFLISLNRLFANEEAALLKGLLLSDRTSLDEPTQEAYRATGLSHLMAVSGLHIGFVAAAAYALFWVLIFRACLRYKPEWAQSGAARKAAAFCCLGPVLFYLLLVGTKVSALRAGIMVCVVLLAFLINRERNLFNALLLAAFALLLVNPGAVLDVGFQLSFAATAAVLIVFQHLTRLMQDPVNRMGDPAWWQRVLLQPEGLPFWRRVLFRIQKTTACGLLISLAVLAATLPILILHFNRVSSIGWALNLFMIPLASLLVPLALATVLIGMALPGPAGFLAYPVTGLVKLFDLVPDFFSRLPFASVYVATPPHGWFLLYAAVLAMTVCLLGIRKAPETALRSIILQRSLCVAAPCLMFWLVLPRFPELPTDTLRIAILDVGQGESIFIEFPNRETLILDGGGFYKNALDVGKRVVAPFLWSQGIGRIDYLAASHSDNDHISGLESLVTLFPVGHFLDGFSRIRDRRIDALRANALAQGAQHVPLVPGTPFYVGAVKLLPLHPKTNRVQLASYRRSRKVGNDRSLVLRLEYKNFSMLLTGDIGRRIENKLVHTAAPLKATLLKSPHHGSRFSNTAPFIDAVSPKAVIFSSGYLNWMKHPHPEVIERYETAGVNIFRTDRDGSIHIETDGQRHQIRRFVPLAQQNEPPADSHFAQKP